MVSSMISDKDMGEIIKASMGESHICSGCNYGVIYGHDKNAICYFCKVTPGWNDEK